MALTREQDRPAAKPSERSQKRILVHKSSGKSAGKAATAKVPPDVAAVPVSEARFNRIVDKRRPIGRLLAGYADTVAVAMRTGRPVTIAFRVLPSGDMELVDPKETAFSRGAAAFAEPAVEELAVAEPVVAAPKGDALDIALAEARARGQEKVAGILKGEDMLTARAFGPLIGASHETVNVMHKRHELLGLKGATRGLRYPRWQVTEDDLPLPGLNRLFAVLGGQPWTVYRFLRTAHAELGGRTALEALKAHEVDAVVEAAQNQMAGRFA